MKLSCINHYKAKENESLIKKSWSIIDITNFWMLWSNPGAPARTVGWHDPGFIHTSSLKDLWPNTEYEISVFVFSLCFTLSNMKYWWYIFWMWFFRYVYRMGHYLSNGSYLWSKFYSFKSSPNPGQDSLQRVIVFGDMGKVLLMKWNLHVRTWTR